MSDHAGQAVHEAPGHAAHDHAATDGLRFEKAELQYFVEDDQDCGRAIGKLLAATFCVLLVLMTGVAIWTNRHQNVGHDPHEVPAAETPAAH